VSNWLLKEFEPGDLARSGLVSDKGRLIFGSHRIMLPYLFKGAITYLRGRYFDREEKTSGDFSKYLGLKNDALGVNTAKRFFNVDVLCKMLPGEKLFVTEGEFDAIVLSKNANVVAVPGVGNLPAEGIMRRLNRFSVVVIPDNDIAGERLIEAIREHVPGARVKRLPDGVKDYTELILN
jgi:DNA primase